MKVRQLQLKTTNFYTVTPNRAINALIDKLPSMYDKQSQQYNKDIHTTHITAKCLRESYFRITKPKPTTSTEAQNFVVGESQHIILQRLLGPLLKAETEKRILTEIKNGRYVGIVSRLDMLAGDSEHLPGGAVVEIKTNKAFMRQIKEYYLEQIKLYLVASSKTKAVLIIIWQNAQREVIDNRLQKAGRMIEAYDIVLTADELKQEYKKIEKRYFELTNALEKSEPAKLFAIKLDINMRKIYCSRYCKYRAECDACDPASKRVFRVK